MDKNTLDFYLNEQVQISASNFIEAIIFAAILSIIIQLVYVKFSTTLSDKLEFSKNFVILGLATTLVITIVKSSLALSLGLVGALSIVRFRAAIKEPEELVYLFLIIATGLGCGSGQITITALGIILSLIIIIIYSSFIKRKNFFTDEITNTTIIFDKRISGSEVDKIIKNITIYCNEIKFVSLYSTSSETNLNLEIKVDKFEKLNKISDEIKKNYSESKILFAKNSTLSL
tara:strand:+ start:2326 stop:3018 length:693 start_codon:yes stop_codon:yes gene_type:complete